MPAGLRCQGHCEEWRTKAASTAASALYRSHVWMQTQMRWAFASLKAACIVRKSVAPCIS